MAALLSPECPPPGPGGANLLNPDPPASSAICGRDDELEKVPRSAPEERKSAESSVWESSLWSCQDHGNGVDGGFSIQCALFFSF